MKLQFRESKLRKNKGRVSIEMKIKYGEIKFYHDWLLKNLSLSGKKNRMRMKFITILENAEKEFQSFRQNLIKEHSRLDEKGNIIILNPDEKGFGNADIIDMDKFNHEYDELVMEEFVIEESESNKEMMMVIKTCIEDCPIEWSGDDAVKYEYVARLFDDIYE